MQAGGRQCERGARTGLALVDVDLVRLRGELRVDRGKVGRRGDAKAASWVADIASRHRAKRSRAGRPGVSAMLQGIGAIQSPPQVRFWP
jgi:hypothetical protein